MKKIRDRERNIQLSMHAGLQVAAGQILQTRLAEQHLQRGSVVVMDPANGDLLASVNLPSPDLAQQRLALGEAPGSLLDRARYGLYPPGSTFKIVTAIAAFGWIRPRAPAVSVHPAAGRPQRKLRGELKAPHQRRRGRHAALTARSI